MRNLFTKLFLLAAMLLPCAATAYDFMVNGLCYNITSDNTVEVTFMRDPHPEYWQYIPAYTSEDLYGDITIPEIVFYEDKSYYVTGIGDKAFTLCNISGVDIPNTVTSIGYLSFFDCDRLSNITFPNSITSIGGHSFQNSGGITNITIPNTVIKIGEFAFASCNGLKSITTPCTFNICEQEIFNNTHVSNLTLTGNVLSGERAFVNLSGCTIDTLNIGCGITFLGALWISPSIIYCYTEIPPICTPYTFINYDGELHVPVTSTIAYITADYWQNFNNLNNDITDKVTISKTQTSMIQWDELKLTVATINPVGSSVKWSTSNPTVASVNENGNVVAIDAGECDIYVTLASNPAVYASCHITVSYPEITSLTLNEDELVLNRIGDTFTLIATTEPTNSGPKPTWSSSDETVATVNAEGVVTAVSEGECDITATVLDKSATCHVTVNSTITITLDKSAVTIRPNGILTLTPSFDPVETEITVTSSDPSVAFARVVTQNGIQKVQVVGITTGTSTITVASTDGKAIPANCVVTVREGGDGDGDVNGDGIVDVEDVNATINIILKLKTVDNYLGSADLNGDGIVDVEDVNAIINKILKLE